MNALESTFWRLAQTINPDAIDLPNKADPGNSVFVDDRIKIVLQVVFGTMGAVAILIIVIAGLQYILSQGDPQKTARAKDAILYAVIGLVVAILAQVIVSFVLGRIF